jgi:hypothetical protein
MSSDRIEAIDALLEQTAAAHGVYEAAELHGVYDQQWATWYAAYAVEHGIGASIGHEVTVDQLAAFLASANAEYEQTPPESRSSWAAYTARRIDGEL